MVKALSLTAKLAITAGLFILFSVVIVRDYKKAKALFPDRLSFSSFIVNPEDVQSRARTTTLNQLMPSFDYLAGFEKNRNDLDRERLRQYVLYYKKIIEYLPGRADAYSMLGFCYYHLGEHEKAVSSYQKAVMLNPHFFWAQYNLAVIFFKDGRYEESLTELKKAAAIPPSHTLLFLRTSKIYQDILRETPSPADTIQEGLKAGYRDCRLLAGLNQYYLKNPGFKSPEGEGIDIRIF